MPRAALILALVLLLGCRPAEETWERVWADEFDGTRLDTTAWTSEVMPDPHNEELQYYPGRIDEEPGANAWVENGVLVIEAREEAYEHRHYTSARLITQGKKEFLYGRFEARMKLPAGEDPAYWPFDHGHGFFILLNLAVGGWFDKPHLPPENMAPQRLYVDYVRVYRRAGSGS